MHARYGAAEQWLGMDGAFEQLALNLGLVRPELGDVQYHRLIDMARASRQKLVEGGLRAGLSLLRDMMRQIRKRH